MKNTIEFKNLRIVHFNRSDPFDILSVKQFADRVGVTPQAVRKMIAEGRLNAQKVGKQHTIPIEELDRYLQTA